MTITSYGHSCVGIRVAGLDLVIDPFVTGNPLAGAIDINTIPATHVLLTHGHVDHVLDAEAVLKRTGALLLGNYEIVSWYGAKGIDNRHHMNLGGRKDLGSGVTVKLVPALHSSHMPDGSYGGNPGGWVVTTSEGTLYHAGDTALTLDMQLLKPHHVDIAFLPIGDNFTMGVDDAIEAAHFVGATRVVGIHYNTFPPIVIDTEAAHAAFATAGIELMLPAIGSSLEL